VRTSAPLKPKGAAPGRRASPGRTGFSFLAIFPLSGSPQFSLRHHRATQDAALKAAALRLNLRIAGHQRRSSAAR
jgi:hypothetical protein